LTVAATALAYRFMAALALYRNAPQPQVGEEAGELSRAQSSLPKVS